MEGIIFVQLDMLDTSITYGPGEEWQYLPTWISVSSIQSFWPGQRDNSGIRFTDGKQVGCKQTPEEIIAKLEEIARKIGGLE